MKTMTMLLLALSLMTAAASYGQAGSIRAMKMEELVQQYKASSGVMVVNFWSIWCKPCIEEIPHFIKVTETHKSAGVQLLLVSLDTRKLYESGKLARYLTKKKWQAEVVWLDETDADYYCPMVDPGWSGAIPATLIVNQGKNYVAFFEESLSPAMLDAEIKKAIGR